MMDTTTVIGKTTFHHNSDYHGTVQISQKGDTPILVDFADLKQFVANWVRNERMDLLRSAGPDIVLFGRE